MLRLLRHRTNNVIIIFISKDKDSVEKILDELNLEFEKSFEEINGLYRFKCYAEKYTRNSNFINSSVVGPDLWVYEFHDGKGFFINNYIYKEIKRVSLSVAVDNLYQTGNLSFLETVKIILRKQIFQLDDDRMYKLLELEDSVLFNSMAENLLEIYVNEDRESVNYSYDSLNLIENKAYQMLRDIRTSHKMFNIMRNLTYDQFVILSKDNG